MKNPKPSPSPKLGRLTDCVLQLIIPKEQASAEARVLTLHGCEVLVLAQYRLPKGCLSIFGVVNDPHTGKPSKRARQILKRMNLPKTPEAALHRFCVEKKTELEAEYPALKRKKYA